jgi:hypothetical protein
MSKNNVIELFIAKSLGKDFHRQNILFNLKKYNILIKISYDIGFGKLF